MVRAQNQRLTKAKNKCKNLHFAVDITAYVMQSLRMTTKYKVLAVNDDKDFCECCGKSNLKKVVWIENTETNQIQHFGVVCAANPAKAFGLDSEIKKAEGNWKAKLQGIWTMAGRLYRSRGGKYVSNGISLGKDGGALVVADESLYAACLTEARA